MARLNPGSHDRASEGPIAAGIDARHAATCVALERNPASEAGRRACGQVGTVCHGLRGDPGSGVELATSSTSTGESSMSGSTWNAVDVIGYAAALLVLSTFYMRTMIPLRCAAIASNVVFLSYGYLAQLQPVFLLHLSLLPLNGWRLFQILRLLKSIKAHRSGDMPIELLLPFMTRLEVKAGTVLFREGDRADRMFYVLHGHIHFPEISRTAGPGRLFGEVGVFSPWKTRTASAVAQDDSTLLYLDERQAIELYYQNPAFGLSLMRHVIEHLVQRKDGLSPDVPAAPHTD